MEQKDQGQTKKSSLAEAIAGTIIGFSITFLTSPMIYGWYNNNVSSSRVIFEVTCWFTILSVVRGYVVRRLFNYLRGKSWRLGFYNKIAIFVKHIPKKLICRVRDRKSKN